MVARRRLGSAAIVRPHVPDREQNAIHKPPHLTPTTSQIPCGFAPRRPRVHHSFETRNPDRKTRAPRCRGRADGWIYWSVRWTLGRVRRGDRGPARRDVASRGAARPRTLDGNPWRNTYVEGT